jgi:predicted nucleic acid-binding protein
VTDLTRAECLVGPLKSGDAAMLADYQLFFSSGAVEMLPLTASVCERAAQLRVASGIRLPDALHIAAAIEHGCGKFVTNDARLSACLAIPVEVLA